MLANLGYLFILPPIATKELGDSFGVQPIGTGKFVLEKYHPNERIVMKRNDNYWGQKPKLGKLTGIEVASNQLIRAIWQPTPVELIRRNRSDGCLRSRHLDFGRMLGTNHRKHRALGQRGVTCRLHRAC